MVVVIGVAFWLLVVASLVAVGMFFHLRNEAVYRYRGRLLARIGEAARCDIRAPQYRDWEWRYDAFEAVTYGEMAWQFWRPLESFYPDTRFVEKGARP